MLTLDRARELNDSMVTEEHLKCTPYQGHFSLWICNLLCFFIAPDWQRIYACIYIIVKLYRR